MTERDAPLRRAEPVVVREHLRLTPWSPGDAPVVLGDLAGKGLPFLPLFTVSYEEAHLRPVSLSECVAANGQCYREQPCVNGNRCRSFLIPGHPMVPLIECKMPQSHHELLTTGLHCDPDIQPCVLCRRYETGVNLVRAAQCPSGGALQMIQSYRNSCKPNDKECYRKECCILPSDDNPCLVSPMVMFNSSDYTWDHDTTTGAWRLDQSVLTQLGPRATPDERSQ